MDTTGPAPDYPDAVRMVRDALVESVNLRLVSDVPVGAFLSGGVDSTAVVGIMARALNHPVQTFTVGFDMEPDSISDRKFNVDARYATAAARHLNTDHHAITIKQDETLSTVFTHLIRAMDEPVTQHAITQTAYIAALARHNGVPVLLSGDAADELFAGYPHYRMDRILERYLKVPALLRTSLLTPVMERLPARFDSLRKLAQKSRRTDPTLRYLEWMRIIELERLPALMADPVRAASAYQAVNGSLRPLLNKPRTGHFADRIAFASLNRWIAEDSNMRVDKMSMMMSVESRSPFMDHKLVELALSLPLEYKLRNGDFKRVLKDAVAEFVPQDVLTRPKWGFAPPSSDWLRTVFRPLVETYLAPERVAAAGYFQPEAVSKLVSDHLSKRRYELWPVMGLLVFHLWHAIYIDQSLDPGAPLTPEQLVTTRKH